MKPLPLLWIGHKAYDPATILRLEADRNYTWLYLTDGRKTIMAHTLAHYTLRLPQYFSRIHRTHCTNPRHIKSIGVKVFGEIELTDGSRLPIARRRWKDVKEAVSRAK